MSKTSVSLDSKKESFEQKKEEKKMSIKTLKDLIFLGRIERNVICGDCSFLMRSLTAEDQRIMVSKVMKLPDDLRLLNAKIISIAFAIDKVNNTPLEDLAEESEEHLDIHDKKISVIKNLQLSVVNKLFKNYEELLEESNSQIEIDEVKK